MYVCTPVSGILRDIVTCGYVDGCCYHQLSGSLSQAFTLPITSLSHREKSKLTIVTIIAGSTLDFDYNENPDNLMKPPPPRPGFAKNRRL